MDEDEETEENETKKYKIIICGLVIHVLLLLAVFDVYFASPLDHGMLPVKSTNNPPAKRLILFVADGLRAQAIFGNENENRIPYLNNIKENIGSWGVAHTRVPTESRPGHVAMLAGIYEDPSAILRGWKSNPVNFDSVINQSSNTWAWGSPDIVKIFNKDNLSKIHIDAYESSIEDFGERFTGNLDIWVFDKVRNFLKNEVGSCIINCDKYHASGNIFFLHLLGIDTAGHGYKPHSKEYIDNIKLVDSYVKEMSDLFNSVYNDGSNVFIFTSDHGMTDWGSHGTGSDHETYTPLIAWGAGIRKNNQRKDIKQVDLSPLLASLLGINIPINSLGILPVNYLNVDDDNLSQMMLSNVMELLQIFNRKMLKTMESALIFIPFNNLTQDYLNEKLIKLREINDFDILMRECNEFITVLMEGVDYYHNYYQYPILLTVSIGFIIWIMFLCLLVVGFKKSDLKTNSKYSPIMFCLIGFISFLCMRSQFSLSYYLYFNFPVIAYFTFLKSQDIRNIISHLPSSSYLQIIYYIIGTEFLVYGFFNKISFTIIILIVGSLIYFCDSLKNNSSKTEKITWVACCSILSIFPSLPTMKTTFNLWVYMLGYIAYILVFIKIYYFDLKLYRQVRNINKQYMIFFIQFLCLQIAATYVVLIDLEYISSDSNLKYISWIIFLLPIFLIPLTYKYITLRLTGTVFGFAPFYFLVSSNYELLFSAFYIFLLYNWLKLESKTFQLQASHKIIYYLKFEDRKGSSKVDSDSFRRAFLFMVFIFIGFFGTGTIASMNSFDPMWVRAFLTVFSPFKMMGLILLKFTVPFIFACSIFRAINEVGQQSILKIFCIILVFSDLMVLQFFYLITNVGSWLTIGTSLSHFIIMEGFVTILLLIYGFAHWLTSVRYKYLKVLFKK